VGVWALANGAVVDILYNTVVVNGDQERVVWVGASVVTRVLVKKVLYPAAKPSSKECRRFAMFGVWIQILSSRGKESTTSNIRFCIVK
jgi:hypothetical protein